MRKSITPRIKSIGDWLDLFELRAIALHVKESAFPIAKCWRTFPEIGKGKNHRCVVCTKKKAILRDQYPGVKVGEPSKTTYRCSSELCKDTYL